MTILKRLHNGRVVSANAAGTFKHYLVKVYYKGPLHKASDGKKYDQYTERVEGGIQAAKRLEGVLNQKALDGELPPQLKYKQERGEGHRPKFTSSTVEDWMAEWIAAYKLDNPESRTARNHETLLRKYVNPVIGLRELQSLKADDVRAVFTSPTMQEVSGTTRLHVYRVLSQALKAAVWDGRLDFNPCDRVKAPKADNFEPYVLTLEDGRRLLEMSRETDIGTLVTLLALTGLRLGEALGLRWQDVDLDGATLHVRQTRKLAAPVDYGSPKTEKSRAPVPLVSLVVDALSEYREAQRQHFESIGIGPEHDLVFADALGRGMTHDFVTHRWQALRDRAGVPRARIHDLRHFAGTLLINLGVDVVTTAAILRHTNPMITLTRYAHAVPQASRDAVNKLGEAIAAK